MNSGARRPTIHDVAKRAGVSKSLVSLVLRGAPTVGARRRAAVMEAVRELGYRPNAVARSLVQRRTGTVGVVISDLHNPFFADVLDGVEAAAEAAGLRVLFGSGRRRPAAETEALDALLDLRVEGLILLSPNVSAGTLQRAQQAVPVMTVGRRYRGAGDAYSIVSDDAAGTDLAVRHLADLGHRRIAHIGGGRRAGGSTRQRGYRQAMSRLGLSEHVQVAAGDFTTEEGGYRAAQQLLAGRRPLTAVLAVNDLAAVGALSALEDAGCRVPEDVSVVGYDNTHVAELRQVDLTSVNQPRAEMGRLAMLTLAGCLDGSWSGQRHQVLQPTLVVRGTSGPAPR